MGAEWSIDSSYQLGELLDCENTFWDIYPAVKKTDGVAATVFIHDKTEADQQAQNCVKHFKTLRHPGLLKCVKIFESSVSITMVTEPLVPLKHVIGDLNTHEVVAGIYNVITTVDFLHNKCKLSHDNLCLDSVFVGQNDACWKVGGLECATFFDETTKEVQDLIGLGKLILDILDGVDVTEDEAVGNFREIVETHFLNEENKGSPEISLLLEDELFKNGYVEILNFLTNITVKSVEEKAVFFRQLHHKLKDLPATLVANRLLHLLLSRFVLFDPVAVDVFLPHLLTPLPDNENTEDDQSPDVTPLLPEHLYKQCCVPILSKLFEVNDRHVRIILLKYFHLYVALFDQDVLKELVLNKLMAGLKDSDDELVSATFSALQFVVPLLGSQVVLGGGRTKQFIDNRPKFDGHQPPTFVDSKPVRTDNVKPTSTLLQHANSLGKNKLSSLPEKTKLGGSKSMEDKMNERERRRVETRRRNEERRKKGELLKMKRETTKKVIKVEETPGESDEDFQPWGDENLEADTNVEVSDGSEYGVPSSSEVSLDSGFCEKNRLQSSLLNQTLPKSNAWKPPETMETEVKTIPRTETKAVTNARTKTTPVKPYTALKLGKVKKQQREVIKRPDSSPNYDTTTISQANNESNATITAKKAVDIPWEDFDINVAPSAENDLFSDMAPTITFVTKGTVKGTSMYSDALAVDTTNNEVVDDAWMDDDW